MVLKYYTIFKSLSNFLVFLKARNCVGGVSTVVVFAVSFPSFFPRKHPPEKAYEKREQCRKIYEQVKDKKVYVNVGQLKLVTEHNYKSLFKELRKKRFSIFPFHKIIFDFCREKKISCFSTPFHEEDVDFLETLKCPMYKVASFELNY